MRSTFRTLAIGLACSAAFSAAQAQKLSPGLWEMTMEMKSQGGEMEAGMAKMQAELAKMPPDQRKQMEAMMASRGMAIGAPAAGGGNTMTVKSCISKENAERGEMPDPDGKHRCKRESTRSGNTIKFKMVCTDPPSTGEGQYTFVSDKAVNGQFTMNTERKGKPERMEIKQTGKWLSADCGALKPN